MAVLHVSDKAPIGVLLTVEFTKSYSKLETKEDQTTALVVSGDVSFTTVNSICRYLVRAAPAAKLYGENILQQAEIDHWLDFSTTRLGCASEFEDSVQYLDQVLAPVNHLVGHVVTLADITVWAALRGNSQFQGQLASGSGAKNVIRYYKYLLENPCFQSVDNTVPKVAAAKGKDHSSAPVKKERKEEGKFIDLPEAKVGEVVVRFPPEASGYLHVGHAKAALLNQFYQQNFKGKLIMRFDDTNPAKEDAHFEKVILEDVKMLGLDCDMFTHTSDYFDLMLEKCTQMIKAGKAYVDDTDGETMKKEREERVESKCRNNSVEQNLKIWSEMQNGTEAGLKCGVRAKMDMLSDNGCMRDPVIYRCKPEAHVRTGTKYKVYPTYDFACPIVDSIEGVTHALRTTEYHDRDDQYYWFIEAMGLRKPFIWEYARLNLMNTVMSKRKLTWFVEQGLVDGWDDPRLPTVRGVLRRGMTVEGLKEFVIAQGSSRSVVMMEWDKIWAFNKKVIDPKVPRYTALLKDEAVKVKVNGATEQKVQSQKHPKDASIGMKDVWYSNTVYMEGADAQTITVGEMVTFINWGNLIIKAINRSEDGKISSVEADLNLENKDYKKTQKLTWLAEVSAAPMTPAVCVHFDHIINKPVLAKTDDFKDFINSQSRTESVMLGDAELARLKKGEMIQLQRRGYYICDSPYEPPSRHSGRASPCVLFNIPDGHTKEMPTSGSKHKDKDSVRDSSAKEKVSSKKGKAAEKSPQEEQTPAGPLASSDVTAIINAITEQGNAIRKLKEQKAPKSEIDFAVKNLLQLKADYKNVTGSDWKPGLTSDASTINQKISDQGNIVRKLKEEKAAKPEVDAAVKLLLELKKEYKKTTGADWKPGVTPPATAQVQETVSSRDATTINLNIVDQGNVVRQLKSAKAPKPEIDAAVKLLLELKKEYKKTTGADWKPGVTPPATAQVQETVSSRDATTINLNIVDQGNVVRQLKSAKAPKPEVDAAVKLLLELKKEYKKTTGADWKPGVTPPATAQVQETVSSRDATTINLNIVDQGNVVRQLKSAKATKPEVDAAVKALLALKADYKNVTGSDWKPGAVPPQSQAEQKSGSVNMSESSQASGGSSSEDSAQGQELKAKIDAQGTKVRELKTGGAAKEDVDTAVKELLALKAQYKTLTGVDLAASGGGKGKKGKAQKDNTQKQQPKQEQQQQKPKQEKPTEESEESGSSRDVKKVTRLGLEARKEENLSDWYSQVITKAEMIEYYDVSGCYILRPGAYSIWETIKAFFDARIKAMGFENCYFPMFVSAAALEREKEHIADFAPEVAWVTKSGSSELAEPVAIRPTSETVMYPSYSKWVQSHRDLPIKLNQWCNVVRWEFKHPQPFLRTREFLWQEGHSAHQFKADAETEVLEILEHYAAVYEILLAIPVIRGRKTEKEKFAGGDYTTTVEAYVSASGRAIQGATSHHLGQNFSKMFDISFENPETQEREFAYQNSWGITTRTIGVLTMVHGDNKGLVLPPRVANIQVILVPCGVTVKLAEQDKKTLMDKCAEITSCLEKVGIKVQGDYRDNYSPGWKFNHWELKGVPLRVEIGPRDVKEGNLVAVRRDTADKTIIKMADAAQAIPILLEKIQDEMYDRAKKEFDESVVVKYKFPDFCKALDIKKLIMAPFCGDIPCEEKIKKLSAKDAVVEEGAPAMGAKSLCIPFKQPADIKAQDKCICPDCTNTPKFFTLFGRSY